MHPATRSYPNNAEHALDLDERSDPRHVHYRQALSLLHDDSERSVAWRRPPLSRPTFITASITAPEYESLPSS